MMHAAYSRGRIQPLVKLASVSLRSTCSRTEPIFNRGVSVARTFHLYSPKNVSARSRFGRNGRFNDVESSSIALDTGRMALVAGAALGLGGLCYYGLKITPDTKDLSALDRSIMWPDYVRDRVKATYGYFAGSAAIATGAAVGLSRSPTFCRIMLGSGFAAPIGMMILTIGSFIVCQRIPYPSSGGLSLKHLAWTMFSASIGATLVPICLIGGPIVTRAALYTSGIVGGLSLVAASAPSSKFLSWGGPLSIGLGVVFISSLGSMFLSPVGRLGAGFYAISLYGGLILFSGFLLYDTQLVLKRAEIDPPVANMYRQPGLSMIRSFDPINNSMHIFMDTINIFARMVAVLGGGQRRK